MHILKNFTAAFLLLFPFLVSGQSNEMIQWSASRLTWNDYLAQPVEEDNAAAITSTALGMEYHVRNNQLLYKITCCFSKTKSWGRFKNDYILAHEQGHFDITEIFARKLAKAINEYQFNPKTFRTDLDRIYKKVTREKERYQNLYDHETDFSRNRKIQLVWLKKINDGINELAEWSNYNTTPSSTVVATELK